MFCATECLSKNCVVSFLLLLLQHRFIIVYRRVAEPGLKTEVLKKLQQYVY
jgi:hypothetical protein